MPRPTRPAHGAENWDAYLESVFDDVYPQLNRSALSGKRLAFVDNFANPVSISPAATAQSVTFTGSTITTGEDYWGVSGTALPMDVELFSDRVYYPDDLVDRSVDVFLQMNVDCDTEDVGKAMLARVAGNDLNSFQTMVTIPAAGGSGGIGVIHTSLVDHIFLGDMGASLQVLAWVPLTFLHDVTVKVRLQLVER